MKVMVLGGVAPHVSLIGRLKERGCEVILADYLDDPPAKQAADAYFQVSTLDVGAIRDLAASQRVDVVMTTCVDHANVTMCTVAEQLGLPHPYSLATALMSTDKARMKAQMRRFGIPTSDFFSVSSADGLAAHELAFPLVVKPADNNGSKGVKRVDDAEALAEALDAAIELSRSKTAIVEGFNAGREIQVDCIARGGAASVLTMREKLKIPSPAGAPMQVYGSVVPAELPGALVREYREIAQKIAEAFGLVNTPFFFQSITDGARISVLELSPRIGGGLSYKLIKDSVGIDVLEAAIDSYFGEIPPFEVKRPEKVLVSTIVYARDGVLSQVVGTDELVADGTIVSWDLTAEPGQRFGNHMDSRNRVGAYYSAAATYAEAREKAARAESLIDVVDAGGTSIKVRGLYFR